MQNPSLTHPLVDDMKNSTRHTPEDGDETEEERLQRLEVDNEWLLEHYNEAKLKSDRADELETELQSADREYQRLQNDMDKAEKRLEEKLAMKLHHQKQHFARIKNEDEARIHDLEAKVAQLRAQIPVLPRQATLEDVLRDMKRLGLERISAGENKETNTEDDDEPGRKRKRRTKDSTEESRKPEHVNYGFIQSMVANHTSWPSYLASRWESYGRRRK